VTRTAKDRGLWLTLSALTVLVVVLGVLQYRWVSEIGQAEGQLRQAQLERAAAGFVRAFGREVGGLLTTFLRPRPGQREGADPHARLLEGLAAWRTSEHARLLSQVLLATPSATGEPRLEACAADESAFHDVPWTPDLEPFRERLRAATGGPGPFFIRPGTLLDPPLAMAFPMRDERPSAREPGTFRVAGVALLRLDPRYVREQLLPQLAEAHFGPLAESEFAMAVVRRADRSLIYATDPADGAGAARPDDLERALPGRWGRFDEDRGRPGEDRPEPGGGPRFLERAPRGPGGPGPLPGRPPEEDSPWLLIARHKGGPLELTVARVRRNNLAVGLGVLALIGATAAVLAAGGQRARRLARQQMEFVAGVTHELNTPLAAIRSAGQNLSDGIVTEPTQVRRYGGLIEKESGRLAALVAQVLDFAGIESGNRAYSSEPLSIGCLVDEVLRDHRLVLDQAGMTVESEVAPDLPEVRGDAAALRRVLGNLVANAAKFAASGRWVGVRASSAAGGSRVVVRVEDRGPGVPRDERGRVFEPFYRGPAAERNATPGSGLGLSLVRHVVRAHGGSVHIEGREGGGAAVVVELPAAGEKAR
jgi:signal transduction histidine kinase